MIIEAMKNREQVAANHDKEQEKCCWDWLQIKESSKNTKSIESIAHYETSH